MIGIVKNLFAGGIGSTVKDVAGVFTENKEQGAQRRHDFAMSAQQQFAAEFHGKGPLNQAVDFINRLPRPAMALGVLWLFYLAMYEPVRFAEAMQGLQLVPDQLWWVLGAIVTFYFGAREMAKVRTSRITRSQVETVVQNIQQIRELREDTPGIAADDTPEANDAILAETDNAAISAFRAK